MSVEYYRNQHVQLLADCAKLRARLAERDRQLTESVDHEVEYERRIAQLVAALRTYGSHVEWCPQNLFGRGSQLQARCTCGFDAALASKEDGHG
jgi:chromosome segregation ATPase